MNCCPAKRRHVVVATTNGITLQLQSDSLHAAETMLEGLRRGKATVGVCLDFHFVRDREMTKATNEHGDFFENIILRRGGIEPIR